MDRPIDGENGRQAGGEERADSETCRDLRNRIADLEARERDLRAIFDSVNDAIFVNDATSGALIDVNERACEMWGYTREEILRLSIEALSCGEPPYVQSEAMNLIRKASESRPQLAQWHCRKKNGQLFWIEVNMRRATSGDRNRVLVVARDITDRRKVESELRESERRYRNVVELIPAGIVVHADFKILYVNPTSVAAARVDSADDMIGRPIWDFIAPEWHETYRERYIKLLKGEEQAFLMEGMLMDAEGNRVNIEGTAGLIEYGGKTAILSTFRNITLRKQAEEALAERTHQLEILSSTSRQLNSVLEIPAVMRTLVASAMELVEAHGGTAALLTAGRMVLSEYNVAGRVFPADYIFEPGVGVPGYTMQTKAPYLSNDAKNDPHVIQEIGGAMGIHTLINVPILNWRGELLGCFELHNKTQGRKFDQNDITMLEGLAATAAVALENAQAFTERKSAQEALQESARMFRLVLDSIPAWVFWKDRDSIYLGCNRLFAANAGLASPEEIIGKSDFDLPWERTEAENYRADDREVMETGMPKLNYEETQKRADGTSMWVQTSKVPLRSPRGEVVGVLGAFEDITSRKRAEQEKRAFYQQTIMAATNGKLEISDEADVRPYIESGQAQYEVRMPSDVARARREVEDFCHESGLSDDQLGLFIIAVGEGITNAVKHAPQGWVFTGKTKNEVWVAITDNGPGIESLILPNAVLCRGFSTKPSLGLGYSIMLDAADRILLKTDTNGTTVILFKSLHEVKPSLEAVPDTWEGIPHSI